MKIDLRSDTVTLPSPAMRQVMFDAPLGDDVYDDDPSVQALQTYAAQKFQHQAALFFPTGTMAGLCALLTHCARGEEYIAGQQAHHYKYEGGGASVLGGIQAQPIEQNEQGEMLIERIVAAIKPDDFHFARTRLICLENTFWGRPLSFGYMRAVQKVAREYKLKFHLDGARLFNAAIALGCAPEEITREFDSVCICLSKGLGAPAGTLLLGQKDCIATAKRWRKMCGGGMRQAGVLAAAGLYALQETPKILAEDHQKAAALAALLQKKPETQAEAHTNMVFLTVPPEKTALLGQILAEKNIFARISPRTRLVLHLGIPTSAIERVASAFLAGLGA